MGNPLSDSLIDQFQRRGCVQVEGLFSREEADLLRTVARRDRELAGRATTRRDADGSETVLAVRDDLGDDLYSAIVRSRRIVDTMQGLLGEEVYHYHHKLMLKEPRVGGAWEWHQDYGYWYNFGCLWPRMASCYVAIDPATRENGCLQVIPESHQLGRLDHGKVGGQTGADPERMAAILERLPVEHVIMQPGDALFFHGNVLHRSDANRSDQPRWALICCYNARSNSPYRLVRHNAYAPLDPLDDQRVLEVGRQHLQRLEETPV